MENSAEISVALFNAKLDRDTTNRFVDQSDKIALFHYCLFSQVISRSIRRNRDLGNEGLAAGQTAELGFEINLPVPRGASEAASVEREIWEIVRGIKCVARQQRPEIACDRGQTLAMITENN